MLFYLLRRFIYIRLNGVLKVVFIFPIITIMGYGFYKAYLVYSSKIYFADIDKSFYGNVQVKPSTSDILIIHTEPIKDKFTNPSSNPSSIISKFEAGKSVINDISDGIKQIQVNPYPKREIINSEEELPDFIGKMLGNENINLDTILWEEVLKAEAGDPAKAEIRFYALLKAVELTYRVENLLKLITNRGFKNNTLTPNQICKTMRLTNKPN